MYIYEYVYMHLYVHTNVYSYVHSYSYIRIYVYVYIHMYTHEYTHTHRLYLYVWVYVSKYSYHRTYIYSFHAYVHELSSACTKKIFACVNTDFFYCLSYICIPVDPPLCTEVIVVGQCWLMIFTNLSMRLWPRFMVSADGTI